MKVKTQISRSLRKNSTPWERKVWAVLKNRNLSGLKFRRQHRIGRYVVDFYCPEKRLIVELDGGQHNFERNIIQDKKRQGYFGRLGL